ncbi:hypothetical protein SGFS_089850 [Streptomyces graminofaciens]|uniref:Uncharacterized protein n=1 Tax=Streptomyces graminofaciens TaxID=68212 RepID=A0ABM7FKQ2_9ACTN|nr:hypothetical protein SGFS_089850 [Streptomyces graminofaciens]
MDRCAAASGRGLPYPPIPRLRRPAAAEGGGVGHGHSLTTGTRADRVHRRGADGGAPAVKGL